MAQTKRKRGHDTGVKSKKFKEEESAEIKQELDAETKPVVKSRSKIAETETDSDPVVESDTTSQSGNDDGVSWPSEDDADGEDAWNGVEEQEDRDGGIRIAMEAAGLDNADPKPQSQHDANKSRESHAKQRATTKERKASKPNADSIARSKKLWEKLRRKSHVPPQERKKLVSELFEIITGHIKDYVFKHDSVRVVQTALKYANKDQNRMIATELQGEYRALAESKYAKFLVGKLLSYGDDEIRNLVIPEFYGHVRKMITHPEASWILDDIYRAGVSPDQKALLLREWYGPEFALFKSKSDEEHSADLKVLLVANPEKRKPIMQSLHKLVNQLVQKKTTGFTMLHDAMLQYYHNLQPAGEEATEFIELLKSDEQGDLLKNLAFTPSGSHLVCLAIAHSNSKDRKILLRSYRDTFKLMTYDPNAHTVILTALDVIDDTVLTSKMIFPTLLGKNVDKDKAQQDELLYQIFDKNARLALLYLSAGPSKAYFPPSTISLLAEIHSIRSTTSKKQPDLRKQELLAHLSPSLLTLIAGRTRDLVSSSFGCQFITETILSAPESCLSLRTEALEAVVTLLRESFEDEEIGKTMGRYGARNMLKQLVQGGRWNGKQQKVVLSEPRVGFHVMVWKIVKGRVMEWAESGQGTVVAALLEAEGFAQAEKRELRRRLEAGRERLERVAEGGDVGARAVLTALKEEQDAQVP